MGTQESNEQRGATHRAAGPPRRGGARRGGAVLALARHGEQPAEARRPRRRPRARRDLPVPTVIGHRGASGYRPEHTLGSYQLALDMGARHRRGRTSCPPRTATSSAATSPRSAARRTSPTTPSSPAAGPPRSVDGVSAHRLVHRGLHARRAEDAARQASASPANRPHNTLYDGRWEIPTFEEVLRWQDEQTRKRGKQVWIYPETKHPTYFRGARPRPGGAGRQAAAQVRQATSRTRRSSSSPSSRPASSG